KRVRRIGNKRVGSRRRGVRKVLGVGVKGVGINKEGKKMRVGDVGLEGRKLFVKMGMICEGGD
ncbi:hypothetical protein, partial [Priestia megaterium]|uniref:hypothetical protein n=1 Tax=Priestia megaterium TaxID=1404 RepID=UPI001649F7E3